MDKEVIKADIGDSVNGKTLTINQVVRFLTNQRNSHLVSLGDKTRLIRKLFLQTLKARREERGTYRTDAFTINELLRSMYDVCMYCDDKNMVSTLDAVLADRY
jgi:hypothetical protein